LNSKALNGQKGICNDSFFQIIKVSFEEKYKRHTQLLSARTLSKSFCNLKSSIEEQYYDHITKYNTYICICYKMLTLFSKQALLIFVCHTLVQTLSIFVKSDYCPKNTFSLPKVVVVQTIVYLSQTWVLIK